MTRAIGTRSKIGGDIIGEERDLAQPLQETKAEATQRVGGGQPAQHGATVVTVATSTLLRRYTAKSETVKRFS